MNIRDTRSDDAAQIIEIYRPAIERSAISFELVVPTIDEMRNRIAESTERFPWLLMEDDNQILGYAYARPFRDREAYRNSAETTVYVDQLHHGKGIGRRLMQTLIERLKRADHHVLIAGITLPNPASVALHGKLGFRAVGVFPEVGRKFDQWHDVGFWTLRLSVPPA